MIKIKKFKIKTHSKKNGKLIPLNFDKKFPIKVKRIFLLYGKKNKIRGNHAHKNCSQLFIPLSGKFFLYVKTPNKNQKIILNARSKIAVLVPPKYWCSIKFLSVKSIMMVACDKYYNPRDYISNFDLYKKYLRKKWIF